MKKNFKTTDVVYAHSADQLTLGDLYAKIGQLAREDSRFKPTEEQAKTCCGIYCNDILRDESVDSWAAIICAPDGKYYEVPFTISPDDGSVTLGTTTTEVVRKQVYVEASDKGNFCFNGNVVKAVEAKPVVKAAEAHPGYSSDKGKSSTDAFRSSVDARKASKAASSANTAESHTAAAAAHDAAARAHTSASSVRTEGGKLKSGDEGADNDVMASEEHTDAASRHTTKADEHRAAAAKCKVEASMKLKHADVVHCRASGSTIKASKTWKQDEEVSFMYMPAGVSTITAGFRDKAVNLTVEVVKEDVDTIQASYEEWQSQFPKLKPFGCIEHKEEDASVHPTRFEWQDGDDAGVYMAAEPTSLGVEHVNGKIHRSWSPSFFTDADYSKAKEQNGVLVFPDGVRGSATNPARITGIAFCVGTLTNKPAFRNISPVKAKEAQPAPAAAPEPLTSDKVLASLATRKPASEAVLANIAKRTQFKTPPTPIKETSEQILARLGKTGRPHQN